jgi:hypothetical protein
MTITLSHEKRRGQQIVSATLVQFRKGMPQRSFVGTFLPSSVTERGGCQIYFNDPELKDDPPEPGLYILGATLADGFTVWAKMEF